MYKVKEIHYTLQGEGAQTGRPAVFVRFSGCNLWSGREEDRLKAICRFCDTDFRGTDGERGGKYEAGELVEVIRNLWPNLNGANPYVVCTGGEPALQLDKALVDAFHEAGFIIAIETNGTVALTPGIDWVCMSPKANTDIVVRSGNEIKIIYPQAGIDPQAFETLEFDHFFIQPMFNEDVERNTQASIDFCRTHPKWRLSVQTHKILGIY